MNIIESNLDTIYAIGDVHGEFPGLNWWIKTNNFKDCIIICCGDFGLGFEHPNIEKRSINRINNTCKENNIELYAIRGNHDDPSYYIEDKFNLSNFKAVSDNTVIKCPSHNILCLGGAISVDRSYRKQQYENCKFAYNYASVIRRRHIQEPKPTYWDNEKFFYDKNIIEELKGINIDVVCSHSAPSIAYPLTKEGLTFYFSQDATLEKELNEERESLNQVLSDLKNNGHSVNKWCYGHFHAHKNEIVENTNFILLDMGRQSKKDTVDIPGPNFDVIQI